MNDVQSDAFLSDDSLREQFRNEDVVQLRVLTQRLLTVDM